MKFLELSISEFKGRRYAMHNGIVERRCGACDRMAIETIDKGVNPPKVGDLVADQYGQHYLVKEVSVQPSCECQEAATFWVATLKRLTKTGAKLHGGEITPVTYVVENIDDIRKSRKFSPIRWS